MDTQPPRASPFSPAPRNTPSAPPAADAVTTLARLLRHAGITLNGRQPWDMQLHHPESAQRMLVQGSLGLGETYMDGAWDCAQLDEMMARILRAKLARHVSHAALFKQALRSSLFNLQSLHRSWQVGKEHYDLGNDFFAAMLDPEMAYTCAYWRNANTLAQAQTAKLDLICRKLQLRRGMRLLDIGCGWGSLMKYAATHYHVECVGLTISQQQAELGRQRCTGLPVTFHLQDYRQFHITASERFDCIASVGMFEHVGAKNYCDFFAIARRSLRDDGLFLLHTIGKNHRGQPIDPWIERHIFPNGYLPSLGQLCDEAEPSFVVEDVHNFGADYDRTLMSWHANFEAAWPQFQSRFSKRFYRMWRYYLLACAGTFRARTTQLWQVVLAPHGQPGGYLRP